jgi:hypothetical protein
MLPFTSRSISLARPLLFLFVTFTLTGCTNSIFKLTIANNTSHSVSFDNMSLVDNLGGFDQPRGPATPANIDNLQPTSSNSTPSYTVDASNGEPTVTVAFTFTLTLSGYSPKQGSFDFPRLGHWTCTVSNFQLTPGSETSDATVDLIFTTPALGDIEQPGVRHLVALPAVTTTITIDLVNAASG